MRTVGRIGGRGVAGIAALFALLALLAVTPASAQSLTLSPDKGPTGSAFTATWPKGAPCRVVQLRWSGTAIASATGTSATGTVPESAKPGVYAVDVACDNDPFLRATFEVTPPPTTVTSPPVTTTSKPVVTPGTPVTTTRPPVTTTTRSRPTTTSSTSTTTTSTTTTTTDSTTSTTSDTPPQATTAPSTTAQTTARPEGDLELDRESLQPGDSLSATGDGCAPNHPVVLTSGGEKVGEAVSDGTGRFTARVEFARVEPGRHVVTAECGIVLTGAVDQIVTSSTSGSSSTLVVLVFFVLAGAALIRVT
ncbi:hypothetical protein [Actinokineospora iranica]|uniref:Ig-like domain (Group 3) n=1 Tax=Actinokineospora iranica TaxID=1271860 RepID=A0A1G6XWX8_9PSEU|nr:hypothetical protein [Actinokineospora iranica]SDD82532.1 hypothetical protein SAMN05216174_11938 [Actinokineospora iranica]